MTQLDLLDSAVRVSLSEFYIWRVIGSNPIVGKTGRKTYIELKATSKSNLEIKERGSKA